MFWVKAVKTIKGVITKGKIYPSIDWRIGYVEVEEEYLILDDRGKLTWVNEGWEVINYMRNGVLLK